MEECSAILHVYHFISHVQRTRVNLKPVMDDTSNRARVRNIGDYSCGNRLCFFDVIEASMASLGKEGGSPSNANHFLRLLAMLS